MSRDAVYIRTLERVLLEPTCQTCDHRETSHCWSCGVCHGLKDRGKRCECRGFAKLKRTA